MPIPAGPRTNAQPPRASTPRSAASSRVAFEKSQGSLQGEAGARLRGVSTYSVVVAVHIIAAFAAYGLPAAYPLILPYLRRHHPESLPGVHAIQYRLNVALTGPFTILLLAAGVYLATDRHRWGETFTTVGLAAVAIIAVVGGAIIVPSTKRLAHAPARLRRRLPPLPDRGDLPRRGGRPDDLRDGGKALVGSAPCRPALPSC